jgi:predicted oxidoreductase
MIWSPIGGGKLMTGIDEQTTKIREILDGIAPRNGLVGPAEAAIAFVVRHPARGLPIIGTGKRDRMDAAIKAAALELDRMDWYEVVTATSPWLEL